MTWTKEACSDALSAFFELHGRAPQKSECNMENGLPHYLTFKAKTGLTMRQYIMKDFSVLSKTAPGPGYPKTWSESACHDAIHAFVSRHGRAPSREDFAADRTLAIPPVFSAVTGVSYEQYLRDSFPRLPGGYEGLNGEWTREWCLFAYDNFLEACGRHPATHLFTPARGLPNKSIFRKLVGQTVIEYRNAKPEFSSDAGIQMNWTPEKIRETVQVFLDIHGRIPNTVDFHNDPSLPSINTVVNRTGLTWSEYRKRFFADYGAPKKTRALYKTAEECIRAIERFIELKGKIPRHKDMKSSNSLPGPVAFLRLTGMNFTEYIHERHGDILPPDGGLYDKEICEGMYRSFVAHHEYLPCPDDFRPKHNMPSASTFKKYVDIPPAQYGAIHYPELIRQAWDAQRCERALKRFVDRNGHAPSISQRKAWYGLPAGAQFQSLVGIGYDDYLSAHYPHLDAEPADKPGRVNFTRELCIERLDTFLTSYGRFPNGSERNTGHGLPSELSFYKNTGMTFAQYVRETHPHIEIPEKTGLIPKKPLWNAESCIDALEQFIGDNGWIPTKTELASMRLPNELIFHKHTGIAMKEYLLRQHPELPLDNPARKNMKWTKSRCIEAIEEYYTRYGKYPNHQELIDNRELPAPTVFKKRVGEPPAVYMYSHYPEYARQIRPQEYGMIGIPWKEEDIKAAIHRFVDANGRAPLRQEFVNKHGLPSDTTVKHVTGKTAMRLLAELYPEKAVRWTKYGCKRAVDQFVENRGSFPRFQEMNPDNGLPTYATFRSQVGKTPKAYCVARFPRLAGVKKPAREYKEPVPKALPPQTWNKETAKRAVDAFVSANGRTPHESELTQENGLPSKTTITRLFDMQYGGFINTFYSKHQHGAVEGPECESGDAEQEEECGGLTMAMCM